MFIETHKTENDIDLTFIKSTCIQAYPCGRRRIPDQTAETAGFRIPFDPEARLNTEANNRK